MQGEVFGKLDVTISENAGKIRASYNVNLIDAVITATALTEKLPLATINTKDFEKIRGIRLY